MANSENLIPAKKGEVRNPKGKPKGTRNRATIFKEMLERVAIEHIGKQQARALLGKEEAEASDLPQQTIADQVVAALLVKALAGDVGAIKEMLDSGYGKLTDVLENTHSFTQMGRVSADVGSSDDKKSINLSFDIGDTPEHQKDE